ncbi:DNA topoisomerase [Psychrobacter jeotgali]|uniref:DNA topoisomerase n=1 Tax=Psychrobacter jeotgali TaxID=179010 RepID=UPI00191913A7|nr:DNA topoisomerase [Psychrobacter jeotgali]
MTNSAHDNISIIDKDALEHIHDSDMRKIYQLIEDMQASEKLGAAHLIQQKIQLDMPKDDSDLFIYLQSNMVMNEGWLAGPLGAFFDVEQSSCLTHEDIKAIENGDFQIQIDLFDEAETLSLTKLLQQMDVFEAGRPSTVAGIIEDLMQKSELIDISLEGDAVKMTPQGYEVHQVLQTHLAKIANVEWNSQFVSHLSQIEIGECDADSVIFEVLKTLYGEEEAESLKQLSWTDPDVLYELQTASQSMGIISKGSDSNPKKSEDDRQNKSRQNYDHDYSHGL